jgi:hypothetical protein
MSDMGFVCKRCEPWSYISVTDVGRSYAQAAAAKLRCFRCNRTPLSEALYHCSDNGILAILRANPNTAMCKKVVDGHKTPKIFQAIYQSCTDDVILAIPNPNKSAAKKRNGSGRLLLHEVKAKNCSSRVILAVLHENPNVAGERKR